MGYGLVAELLANRPPGPGPEWWLLLDLAEDADDHTRVTACGLDYMLARTQASERTVYRWLAALGNDGLVRVVSHSRSGGRGGAKGVRAVYEIQVPPEIAARAARRLETGSTSGITCYGGAGDSGSRTSARHRKDLTPDGG